MVAWFFQCQLTDLTLRKCRLKRSTKGKPKRCNRSTTGRKRRWTPNMAASGTDGRSPRGRTGEARTGEGEGCAAMIAPARRGPVGRDGGSVIPFARITLPTCFYTKGKKYLRKKSVWVCDGSKLDNYLMLNTPRRRHSRHHRHRRERRHTSPPTLNLTYYIILFRLYYNLPWLARPMLRFPNSYSPLLQFLRQIAR